MSEQTAHTGPRSLVNLRDVATASPRLRPGVLLRSDAPLADDVHEGYDVAWPPATVLDLRDEKERGGPHPLEDAAESVLHLPLLTGAPYTKENSRRTLERLYLDLLESPVSAGLMVDAVDAVAHAPAPVLVHCTAGKDRTGITVALVLRLVGVGREEIVTDYLRTAEAMEHVMSRMAVSLAAILPPERIAALPTGIHATPVDAMNAFLDALEDEGGAEAWYAGHGGSAGTLADLRARLLG